MTYVLTPPSTVLGLRNLSKKSATPLDLLQKRNCFSKLQQVSTVQKGKRFQRHGSIQGRKRSLKKLEKAKKHSHYVYKDSQISACPVGKYLNKETGLFAACVNSKPQRFGYYCEKEPFKETALKVLKEMREALEWIDQNKGQIYGIM